MSKKEALDAYLERLDAARRTRGARSSSLVTAASTQRRLEDRLADAGVNPDYVGLRESKAGLVLVVGLSALPAEGEIPMQFEGLEVRVEQSTPPKLYAGNDS